MSHIFISYSKHDLEFARYLRSLLETKGFCVWLDETRLVPSDRWWPTIEHNIETCMAFVVIMSSRSRMSEWVEREILYAEQLKKPVFPVLMNGSVWPRLANIQYADMRAGYQAALPCELVRGLNALSPAPEAITALRWPPRDLIARVHGWETIVAWRRKSRRRLRWSLIVTLALAAVVLTVGGVLGSTFDLPVRETLDLSGASLDSPIVPVVAQLGAATMTPLPRPTASPIIEPTPKPDIHLFYSEDVFLLVNTSGAKLNVSQLVFEQGDRRWEASQWDTVGTVSTAQMSAGGCYQLITYEGRRVPPNRAMCPQFLGWFRAGLDDRYFWLADKPGATFTVRLKNNRDVLQICEIDANQCIVDLAQ